MSGELYLGIDVGASNIKIGIGDENDLHGDKIREVSTDDQWSEEGLLELMRETLEIFDVTTAELDGIGIGVPGLVDIEEKKMEMAYALEELSFKEISELGVEFTVENDANTAVLGEKVYGDGKDKQNLLTVIMGSGIGGGVYYGGRLLGSQKNGSSPEPAGITVDGETTWGESLGGENMPQYLAKNGADIDPEETTAEEIFDQEIINQKYFSKLVDLNARGISTLINLYAPELITFSGSVAVNNPEFMKESFQKAGEISINPEPEMKISDLGNNLGLYGALAVARRKIN